MDLGNPANKAAISKMRGKPDNNVVVPQVLRISLWRQTNMLDSDSK